MSSCQRLNKEKTVIKIHHLNDSRSQRILWLLEEMGVDYEVVPYMRDLETRLAPETLKAVHPLGKSPLMEDGDLLLHESGAITEYLIRRYGNGKFEPAQDSADYPHYVEWLHYAEGSAMLPLLLRLYTSRLGDAAAPLNPRIDSETMNHFGFINKHLQGREFFIGNSLTGADFMMSFPLEAANARGAAAAFPAIADFVARIQSRPAYLKALEKGGEYSFAQKAD
nr:glutathione S-transferase [Sneathiella aquimaris]